MSNTIRTLFLITGHSAVGKTTLINNLLGIYDFPLITKVTTRQKRDQDKFSKEVVPISNEMFLWLTERNLVEAVYEKYGKRYGFMSKSDIINISGNLDRVIGLDILAHKNSLTVGDAYEAPKLLGSSIRNLINILLYARPETIKSRLRQKSIPKDQLKKRLASVEQISPDGFPVNAKNYDYAISTDNTVENIVKIAKANIEKSLR